MKVGEKEGGGGLLAVRSAPKGNWLLKWSKERRSPEDQVGLI